MQKYLTKSSVETQNLGKELAKKVLVRKSATAALIIGLRGDLGAGKTTFLQGFARGLGITEKILSPTFVILKKFKITSNKRQATSDKGFKNFYHIDCYRLKNEKDLEVLGFKEIILNPENIVAIEWPERISKILPQNIIKIKCTHFKKDKRKIIIHKS